MKRIIYHYKKKSPGTDISRSVQDLHNEKSYQRLMKDIK